MAASASESKKRKSKRKSRTAVPSPSPSSSDNERSTAINSKEDGVRAPPRHETEDLGSGNAVDSTPARTATEEGGQDAEQAFADFYLRQAASEFANDLDKLRSAGDFHGERSVEVLVEALRQGTGCFGKEERVRIGRVDGEEQ